MSIRNKLLTLLIAGFAVLLAIFFASTQTLNTAAKNFTLLADALMAKLHCNDVPEVI